MGTQIARHAVEVLAQPRDAPHPLRVVGAVHHAAALRGFDGGLLVGLLGGGAQLRVETVVADHDDHVGVEGVGLLQQRSSPAPSTQPTVLITTPPGGGGLGPPAPPPAASPPPWRRPTAAASEATRRRNCGTWSPVAEPPTAGWPNQKQSGESSRCRARRRAAAPPARRRARPARRACPRQRRGRRASPRGRRAIQLASVRQSDDLPVSAGPATSTRAAAAPPSASRRAARAAAGTTASACRCARARGSSARRSRARSRGR